MSQPLTPIDRGVNAARRRLTLQVLVNRLVVGWLAALSVGLVWVLAEPWLFESAPANQKWYVVGGLLIAATVSVLTWTIRTAPSRAIAALELDNRFGLKERVTTALGLDAELRETSAGQALFNDAVAKVQPISVREKFPVRPRWHAALLPLAAGLLAGVAVFLPPDQMRQLLAGDESTKSKTDSLAVAAKNDQPKSNSPFTKIRPKDELERTNKSEKLKDLEAELDKMVDKFDRDREPADQVKNREKVTELTKMEDKLKQFNDEKFQKLAELDKRMQELNRLQRDPDFSEGPAKELNDALAKGDLKKAKEEVDELKKKAKQKDMTKEEQQKLERQLNKMKDEMERLARDKEKEQKLKDMIKQAKEQGKDAESLERELEKMQKEGAAAESEMKELAQKLQKAQQALQQGNLDDLADELEKVGAQLKEIEGELQDLEDAQQYLQKLKEAKKKACAQCEGDCPGDKPGDKDFAKGKGIGSGQRGEEKDDTSWTDERQKGLFDPRGKKVYGGGVRGPAFTKKSTTELGQQIKEAVQEAPSAVDTQRLPRDARDSVKEYFESLGGSAPKK